MECPRRCIKSGTPFYILQEKCDDCGICFKKCPYKLIEIKEHA